MVFRNLFLVIFILFAGKMLSQTAMPYRWNTVCIGGGGFVSGIVTSDACKDLVYARTDVGGAYRWNADTRSWTALTDWAGEEELGFLGVESIAIDENDADKLYLCVGTSYWNNGKSAILISEDRGDTFSVVDVSGQFRFHGNGIGRGGGERLAVHPANSKILFCGTRADGLWKSSDGAATWTKVESFPIDNLSKENGITSVFFDSDRRRGHGGLSKVFVTTSVRGNPNFFVSEDCGNMWKAVEGARTDYAIQHVAQASDRTLYICYADGCPPHASSLGVLARGAVMKYHVDTGEWLDITPMRQSRPYCGVSVCRDNPEKVVVTTTNAYGLQRWHEEDVYGDEVFRSTDGGKTWTPLFAEKRNKLDHGDFEWGKKHSLHWASDIEIDPFCPNRAWVVSGNGVFMTEQLWEDTLLWTYSIKGIEETVPLGLAAPASGAPLLSVIGDYDGFRHDSLDRSPTGGRFAPVMGTSSSIACAALAPWLVVRSGNKNAPGAFYSKDNGVTWNAFGSRLDGNVVLWGGTIVLSAHGEKVVWRAFAEHNAPPRLYVSADWGESWTRCEGVADEDILPVADASDDRLFYGYGKTSGVVYLSRDGGRSFQEVSRMKPGGGGMLSVPGYVGTLLLPLPDGLWISEDCGGNWRKLPLTVRAESAGVGKPFRHGEFPVIYFSGIVDGKKGIFRSDDKGENWYCISDNKKRFGGLGNARLIVGDMQKSGRVYLSTAGRGIVYGEPLP